MKRTISYAMFRKVSINKLLGKVKRNSHSLAKEYLGLEVY